MSFKRVPKYGAKIRMSFDISKFLGKKNGLKRRIFLAQFTLCEIYYNKERKKVCRIRKRRYLCIE